MVGGAECSSRVSAADRPAPTCVGRRDAPRRRSGHPCGGRLSFVGVATRRYSYGMMAKEKLLEQAPGWTDAQAIAALRAVETQGGLAAYFDDEAKLPANELDGRDDRWAEANARKAVREEPW